MKRVMNRIASGHVGCRRLAIFIIIGLLTGLTLPSLSPRVVEAAPPNQPSNVSPADGTTEISLFHPFVSSAFSPTGNDTHLASQWQITAISGNYASPVFDSGVDFANLITFKMIPGHLLLNTTYYWHVRHQNDKGEWSDWSNETSFKTIVSGKPSTPINVSPVSGSNVIAKSATLESSAFVSLDGGATHAASQWQITAISGNYTSPVLDSGLDTADKVKITVPPGNLLLNTIYYWRVKYQDNYGNWSDWSAETNFKTIISGNPSTPINVSPVNGSTGMAKSPTLESSAFVSLDGGATHAASQWQITAISGNYTSPILDSGLDTADKVTITVPPESLYFNTTYYWRVRHQDSYGNWSAWSAQTSFTTMTQPPTIPGNIAPASGATGINVTPTLNSSAFADLDVLASHSASQWQVTAISGNYSSPVYEGGADTLNKTSITIPNGKLNYITTYYWHVRYQDNYGNWSAWSVQTSFTTTPQPPNTPGNIAPANGATVTGVTPTLTGSVFSDPYGGDSHKASRWQITIIPGNYTSLVYDSNPDITNKTSITIPNGKLSYNTTYYWHVRYQNNYGIWSDWSAETSFTTTTQAPVTPGNIAPGNGATVTGVTPTLTGSAFSDSYAGDSHKASQWQVTAISENYTSLVYNSNPDITNKASITIPNGKLSYNTTYYWHVRYQDSYGNWSDYSSETAFTTGLSLIKADFSAAPIQVTSGQTVTFSDNSTGDITSWVWDFGDGATKEWTVRPDGGKVTHSYLTAGSYTVSLKVAGAVGKDTRTKASLILASAPHSGEGLPWIPIIIGIGVVLVCGGLFWYLRRRSQYYT